MESIWDTLYEAAKQVQSERTISDYVEAGGMAAAILSSSGNIYIPGYVLITVPLWEFVQNAMQFLV